jgi:hypothetical protein
MRLDRIDIIVYTMGGDTNSYRFQSAIYVVHAFQKKSRKGIATPREHIEMIKRRLKQAAEIDAGERKGPLR